MGSALRRLFRRKPLSVETVREEFRKMGLVLTAGGIIAVLVQSNLYGFSAAGIGIVFYYFGITEQTEDL